MIVRRPGSERNGDLATVWQPLVVAEATQGTTDNVLSSCVTAVSAKFHVRSMLMRLACLCRHLVIIGLVALATNRAFCGIRPSFMLDYSSWHATHIVLVTTTTDGATFEVLESWKGDLKTGERIVIPQLRPAQKAIAVSLYPKSWEEAVNGGVNEGIPKQLPGSRMVLFLRSSGESPTREGPERTARHLWEPADLFSEMKTAALWIDGSQVYGFVQLMNPGPSVLFDLSISEQRVRERVLEVGNAQQELAHCIAESDGANRAECLKPYAKTDIFPARKFALDELAKAGPGAVPAIRRMLDDPSFSRDASALVNALAMAGGEGVAEELNTRLRQDLAFWKSTAPSLSQGWWNQDLNSGTPLRGRYSETYQLLVALEHTHYSPGRTAAIELCAVWSSVPAMSDPSSFDQMADECRKLTDPLQPNNNNSPEN